MTISLDELGIWQSLGTITPKYNLFELFPLATQQDQELFRVLVGGDQSRIKSRCYFRQILGNSIFNQWSRFYPQSGNQNLLLRFPDALKGQKLLRQIAVTKRWYRKRGPFGADVDSIFTVTLEQFIPFTISQPGLTDQEKAYLDELLKQYITEAAITNSNLPPSSL